jgi:hypothetical protein
MFVVSFGTTDICAEIICDPTVTLISISNASSTASGVGMGVSLNQT